MVVSELPVPLIVPSGAVTTTNVSFVISEDTVYEHPPSTMDVIAPPTGSERTNVSVFEKVAVTARSALITTEHGLVVPAHAPLQPVNAEPLAGVAAMLTVVPSSYVSPAGVAKIEPLPEPAEVSVNVRSRGRTVSVMVFDLPPQVAVMITVPAESAVAVPVAGSTEATVGSPDVKTHAMP